MPRLIFKDGVLILEEHRDMPPFFRQHGGKWRAKPMNYAKIIRWLKSHRYPVDDQAKRFSKLDLTLKSYFELRPYQEDALDCWKRSGYCGSVVLPTGSGKTFLALRAMEMVPRSALIVLPTIDLMNQWYDLLSDAFHTEIGVLGGGYHEIRDVTVTTYDSAYRYVDLYGNRFGLLIFDEVHHLPAPKYSDIPEMSIAPYRLGLTATYKRTDGRESGLQKMIGGIVYMKTIKDFKGKYLSDYHVQRIRVNLTAEEQMAYDQFQETYLCYIREKNIRVYGSGWQSFIQASGYDRAGREALLAKHVSDRIISQAKRKFTALESILKQHDKERILIFTKDVNVAYKISRRYLIPAITHYTNTKERKEILDYFRKGIYRYLVSSEVLNEGVDIPEANIGVIMSGTASPVRHVQRLGRILRKKENKEAILYEIITLKTKESSISYRRRDNEAFK